MRTVTVLLTKYSDLISNVVYYLAGHGYTHASLGLDEDENTYYSFNYRGFCIETLEKHRNRGVTRSLSYQINVSDAAYKKAKEYIEQFKVNKADFQYTRVGLLFCVLKIPFKWEKHYFCSQFVAEVLKESGAVELKSEPTLYLPNHFYCELSKNNQLYATNYDLL